MSLPTFTSTTTAEEVAAVFANQIKGKNVLITGTSIGGIGFEAARVIAKYAPNLLILASYSPERLKLSEDEIKKETPHANIRLLTVDLSSLASVRRAAAEVNAYAEPLHVLIHNAAGGLGPFKLTEDKFESQMATDHLGPFLFTKLVLPKLLAAGSTSYTPRVVFVSSAAEAFGTPIDFDAMEHPTAEKCSFGDSYNWAKSANILTATELSRRAQGKINAYSLHPGGIFTNIQQREESKDWFIAAGILTPDGKPNPAKFEWKTIPQGAATTVAASFDTRLDDQPGAYLWDGMAANDKISANSTDPAKAATLWALTEKLIGEKFEL
ncbi:hypothetical protein DFH07DRAFT_246352 [Mycena maculata]|uniref:Short-chain dehydrogenase/reductase n=1 Tax=Mycena maculata TaxID=230809 RepID=A0AAD7HRI1_9AGAR|nr:hypothetical protein DFH07DRAFT_246352 [Mycena maculata]